MSWDEEDVRIDRAAAAKSFHAFVRRAWVHLEAEPFVDGWHLRLLCDELEEWVRMPSARLVLNQPPGTMKSLLCCVFLPAWVWTWWPEARWIFTAYDQKFSSRDGGKTMELTSSDWYRARWPKAATRHDDAERDFSNSAGGSRFATSMTAGALGRHAHFIVADDPLKPVDAFGRRAVTRTEVEECLSNWKSSFARAALPGARKLIVMQRLHQDDLAAYCIRRGYRHVRLVMRAEEAGCPEARYAHVCVEDPRSPGELLWPERMDEAFVADLSHEMGAQVAAAQLQQRPSPLGGGYFHRATFRYWRGGLSVKSGVLHQSWDLTFGSKSSTASWVVGQLWWSQGAKRRLVDRVRGRFDFIETVGLMRGKAEHELWGLATGKLVEKKANGAAVIDTLHREVSGLIAIPQPGEVLPSKESRWNSVQPQFEAGDVEFPHPEQAPWEPEFEELLLGCGSGFDDDGDTLAQYLRYVQFGSSYRRGLAVLQSGAR